MRIIRGSIVGLAGAVGAGVLAWPAVAGPGADRQADDVYLKRNEQAGELVTVDDDELEDDDELQLVADTRSRDTRSRVSRASRDNTRSNVTRVSRDRDRSRGDKTRDWTRDGAGDQKRDWSANRTNDRSRNDTRR